MGKTRARHQTLKEGGYSQIRSAEWSDKVLNLQVSVLNSTYAFNMPEYTKFDNFFCPKLNFPFVYT